MGGGSAVTQFSLGSVLKPSLPVQKEAGVSYLVIDLGSLRVKRTETTLGANVRLRGATVREVKIKSVDLRVTDIGAPAAATADMPLDAVVDVPIPAQPGPVMLDVDVPVPEVLEAGSDDAAAAALRQNYDLLLTGKITRGVYSRARNTLVNGHSSAAGLASQLDSQMNDVAETELQYLRVQGEYFTAKTDELKAKAAQVADGVQDPMMELGDSDSLESRSGRMDRYHQARSKYAAMLEQVARYKTELEGLQERGFAIAAFPPETNRFLSNARYIETLLQPYLDQRQNGFLAERDSASQRFAKKTEWLLQRAAAMRERVNASRSRVANARSVVSPVAGQNKALEAKGLFQLTWGMDNLLGTMNGILTEEQNLKDGKSANIEWLNHYKNRLPEFYAMASQMLETMYPILGVKHQPTFPAETFEGFLDRMQPWMDVEAPMWNSLEMAREQSIALAEANSATGGNVMGVDFAIAGDQKWMDLYNAFSQADLEAIKREAQEFQTLLGLAQNGIRNPASEADTIQRWVAYLKESGYELKTAAAAAPVQPAVTEPPPADPNIGQGKITFQVGSSIVWVIGRSAISRGR